MAQYVTKIRTENGDLPVDYKSLANLPTSDATLTKSGEFADAKVVGEKIQQINNDIKKSVQDIKDILDPHIIKLASDAEDGHLSSADKVKLDGIEKNANNYSLPTASSLVLGGVTTTSEVDSTDGLTACPIVNGVPYYFGATLGDYGVTSTAQELNMISGLSSVLERPKMETITLLASGWIDNEQTVSVQHVTQDNLVMVSPDPSNDNYLAYVDSNIRCIAQSNGTLTFNREYESDVNIIFNVVAFM
jgi:hypothetical protein